MLIAQIIATFWAFTLPKVDQSLYFHRKSYANDVPAVASTDTLDNNSYDGNEHKRNEHQFNTVSRTSAAATLLWTHFRNAYTNRKVLQWSLWYAVGLCGYLQVISYVQLVWKDIEPSPDVRCSSNVLVFFIIINYYNRSPGMVQ